MLHREQRRMALAVLQVAIGMAALPSGIALIIDPSGAAAGMEGALLPGAPFRSFLIPGLLVFGVNGLGSLLGAWWTFKDDPRMPAMAAALGSFLVTWIVGQWFWLAQSSWLQPAYLIGGVLQLGLGLWLRPGSD